MTRAIAVSVLFLSLGAARLPADSLRPDREYLRQDESQSEVGAVLERIERGINRGDVSSFSDLFARQAFISVRRGVSGYFSANQAPLILQNFFSAHPVSRFRFTTSNLTAENPYATGGGVLAGRGSPERVQVYLALSKLASRWVIVQFNVY